MIRYYTFGESAIEVGGTRIGPASSRAFAALLYLGAERDRRISRATLQGLLFPTVSDANAAHSLRQLTYRLRQLGVPLSTDLDSVGLLPGVVVADYTTLLAARRFGSSELKAIAAGFLPGYTPHFSEPFEEWCEEFRGRVTLQLRYALVEYIRELRRRGLWYDMEHAARACLALDPLNDEGTAALAEALAATGSREEALQALNRYQQEVREPHPTVTTLKSRIRALPIDLSVTSGTRSLLERGEALERLGARLALAATGRSQTTLLLGATGAGKSRMLAEYSRSAAMKGVQCLDWRFRSIETRQPLALFSGLAPRLLRMPGALGCSPASLQLLNRLTRAEHTLAVPELHTDYQPDIIAARLEHAIIDLIQAISAESTIAFLLDDCDRADSASLEVLRVLASQRDLRMHVVAAGTDTELIKQRFAPSGVDCDIIELQPLSERAVAIMLSELLRGGRFEDLDRLTAWCYVLTGGNPLSVELFAHQLLSAGPGPESSESLASVLKTRIAKLTTESRVALNACVGLGAHCTLGRLTAVTGLSSAQLTAAIRELEETRLIRDSAGTLECVHDVVGRTIFDLVGSATRRALHYSIAEQLQADALCSWSPDLLWACADHWQLAGECNRAVDLLRLCSRHAVDIGQAADAVQLLQRAVEISNESRKRCDLLREAMEIADAAGEWNDLRGLIDASRREPELAHATIDLADLAVREGWALWRSGQAIADRRDQLLHIARSAPIASNIRLSAAGLLIYLADRTLDTELGHDAISVVRTLAAAHGVDVGVGRRYELVFEVVFGDVDHATELARKIITSTVDGKHPGELCTILYNVGLALFRLGQREEAEGAMRKCFEIGSNIPSPTYISMAAAGHCLIARAYGDCQGAREWHERAMGAFESGRVRSSAILHYSNCVDLALDESDSESARYWIARSESEYGGVHDLRSHLVLTAYQLLVHRLIHGTCAEFPKGEELLAGHRKARMFGMHDRVALAAMLYLVDHGNMDEAHSLRAQYESVYRRDSFPLPRAFTEF